MCVAKMEDKNDDIANMKKKWEFVLKCTWLKPVTDEQVFHDKYVASFLSFDKFFC
jgi:hypothetical protein